MTMRTLHLLSSATLLATAFLSAQTPAPRSVPSGIVFQKSDPDSPANIGRSQLTNHLDTIADQQLTTRRTTIATIKTRTQAEARQVKVRKQILNLIGGLPEKTPLNAHTTGTTQLDGFRIE